MPLRLMPLSPQEETASNALFQSFYRGVDASHYESDELFWYLFDSIRLDKPFLDIDMGKLP